MYNMARKKVVLIYHSGAGNTKTIASIFADTLFKKDTIELTLLPVEGIGGEDIETYDYFIMGFPIYHSEPSKSMMTYLENLPVLKDKKPLFVFGTYGLYPSYGIRLFAKKALEKNFLINGYAGYRCPASDGSLLMPIRINGLLKFEKNIMDKIQNHVNLIYDCIES